MKVTEMDLLQLTGFNKSEGKMKKKDKVKVFKVNCEYLVRANTREEIEEYVQDEVASGFEFYERHILIDDVTPTCGGACLDVDVDLTK